MSDTESPNSTETPLRVDLARLVVRLRSGWTPFADEISGLMREAADEIETLSAQKASPVPLPTREHAAGEATTLKWVAFISVTIFIVGVPLTGFLMHPALGWAGVTAMALLCARAAASCIADREKDSSHNADVETRASQDSNPPQNHV